MAQSTHCQPSKDSVLLVRGAVARALALQPLATTGFAAAGEQGRAARRVQAAALLTAVRAEAGGAPQGAWQARPASVSGRHGGVVSGGAVHTCLHACSVSLVPLLPPKHMLVACGTPVHLRQMH